MLSNQTDEITEKQGRLMQFMTVDLIFIVSLPQAIVACKDQSCGFAVASRHQSHYSGSVGSCEGWQTE